MTQLLERKGIDSSQVDGICTRENLVKISMFLESWRTVVCHLKHIESVDVEEVEREGTGEKEKKLKILEKWKCKLAFKATYRVLIEALLEAGRADQAMKVCDLLLPQPSKEGTTTQLCI